MSESTGDWHEPQPTLLDEACSEIIESIGQEHKNVVKGVVTSLIGKNMIRPEAMMSSGDYIYLDMYPHPENPISENTFEELDTLIKSIENDLEINDSRYHSVSKGQENEPTVSVSRYANPDKYRGLGIFLEHNDGSVCNISVRNDAGTQDNRYQLAGNKTTYNKLDIIARRETKIISDQQLASISNLVLARAQQETFVKEREKLHI